MEKWAGLGEVPVKPRGGTFADREHPALAVFALPHDQGAGGGIVIAGIEVGHFRAPDTGGVEEFQNCTVAQAERIGDVGFGEEALDFQFVEGFGQVASLFAREIQIGGGIGRDVARAAEPGEEAADAT